MEELEEAITLSNMATPKMGKRLHIPVVRIHDAQVRATNQPAVVRYKCFHGSKVVRSQGQIVQAKLMVNGLMDGLVLSFTCVNTTSWPDDTC